VRTVRNIDVSRNNTFLRGKSRYIGIYVGLEERKERNNQLFPENKVRIRPRNTGARAISPKEVRNSGNYTPMQEYHHSDRNHRP